MERSLRHAERLVNATNSALEQIQFSLMFDDLKLGPEAGPGPGPVPEGKRIPKKANPNGQWQIEFEKFENEFKTEATEMLSKMDRMLESTKSSFDGADSVSRATRARSKIKEINAKVNKLKSAEKTPETARSRQKLLSLITEEDNSSSAFSENLALSTKKREAAKPVRDVGVTVKLPLYKSSEVQTETEKPTKSIIREKSKELKSKILETQEIVDRGFQTARLLAQKVDSMTKIDKKIEKTPCSEKTTFNDDNCLESLERKASNETIRMSSCRKCEKHCRDKEVKRKEKKIEKDRREEEKKKKIKEDDGRTEESRRNEENNKILNIKRKECPKSLSKFHSKLHLKLQRLPSVNIKRGLQIQKVHSLDIPPEEGEHVPVKDNAVTKILSHEQIEKEKTEKMIEEVKKVNCFCEDNETLENAVECFNCGKVLRLKKKSIDPREIDRVLLKCNFDVFDPRIDEFVQHWNEGGDAMRFLEAEKPEEDIGKKEEVKTNEQSEEKKIVEEQKVIEKKSRLQRRLRLQELSEEISKKYKEKMNNLEESQSHLENILRNLYEKIYDTKDLFNNCQGSSPIKSQIDRAKISKLSKTTPVVVCITDSNMKEEEKQDKVEKGSNTIEDKKNIAEAAPEDYKGLLPKEQRRKRRRIRRVPKTEKAPGESESSEEELNVKNKVQSDVDAVKKLKQKSYLNKKIEIVFKQKQKPQKLEKTDVKNKNKSRTFPPNKREVQHEIVPERTECHMRGDEMSNLVSSNILKSGINSPKREIETEKKLSKSRSLSDSSKKNKQEEKEFQNVMNVESDSEQKTENDYESDFERDSLTVGEDRTKERMEEETEEQYEQEEVEEEEGPIFGCAKKLSTILEVDSDLEKRMKNSEESLPSTKKSSSEGQSENVRNDIIGVIEMPNSKINNGINEVLSKAFEKGITYTLEQQKNILKSSRMLKPEILKRDLSSSSGESQALNKMVSSESKSGQNSKRDEHLSSKSNKNLPSKQNGLKTSKTDMSCSQKSSSAEVMNSLKEVLSALKEQFARTQTLADKLTENTKDVSKVKESKEQRDGEDKGNDVKETPARTWNDPRFFNNSIIDNLKSARKAKSDSPFLAGVRPKSSEGKERRRSNDESISTLLSEGGSSLGEVNVKLLDLKRKDHGKSDSSSNSEGGFLRLSSRKKSSRRSSGASGDGERKFSTSLPLGSKSEDVSYSEGEVPSNILIDPDCISGHSVGEVISERISIASSFE